MAPVTHTIEVQYNEDPHFIRWLFNGDPVTDPRKCAVKCDDEMEFWFHYIGPSPDFTFAKAVLLMTNPTQPIEDGPFTDRKDVIRLSKKKTTLTLGKVPGDWPFSISFSVRSSEGVIGNRYVPDPELQVSTTR